MEWRRDVKDVRDAVRIVRHQILELYGNAAQISVPGVHDPSEITQTRRRARIAERVGKQHVEVQSLAGILSCEWDGFPKLGDTRKLVDNLAQALQSCLPLVQLMMLKMVMCNGWMLLRLCSC